MRYAVLALLLIACAPTPRREIFSVRNLESKCALIALSGCRQNGTRTSPARRKASPASDDRSIQPAPLGRQL